VIWLSQKLGYAPDTLIIGSIFFIIASLYSVYGAWNAFNPQIKNVQVSIKNLPEQWKGKRIVQLSDVHLGHVYQTDFLAKIVKMTNELRPDVVVITGDLFDGMDGHLENLVGPLKDLQAPYGTYFITGNHETYLGVDKSFSILDGTKVKILNDAVKDLDGLQLIGISYPERGQVKNLGQTIKMLPDYVVGKPTILLYHAPTGILEAKEAGVNLQLSGHTHVGQLFPFSIITDLIYKGYDYGLHTLGDYSIYTTNGVGTWGPPIRTGNTPEIVNITLGG
jgi:predicted MPP superfamily phosphohydrolase